MEDSKQKIPAAGGVHASWMVDEYPTYSRSWRWYVVASVVGAALLVYALATLNFLFALIIVIFAIVTVVSSAKTPVRLRVALTEDGVLLGHEFIPWLEVSRFWIAYEPPQVKTLYLDFKSALRPDLSIGIDDQNPSVLRRILLTYVDEDTNRNAEPLADFLGRVLKM